LRKKFDIEPLFLDNHSGGLSFQESRDVSIIIVTPLSVGITAITKKTDIPIVGICMAYEINEEAKDEKNRKQIIENINRCAGIQEKSCEFPMAAINSFFQKLNFHDPKNCE
jgi:hypothetical protein